MPRRSPLIAFLLLAASQTFPGEKAPEKPKPFETAPNWKVEVIASFDKDPKVLYTSVVCALPDGRILAAEDPMDMIGPANQPVDRILCFHPDGHVTVFADKLYAVFGLGYIDGKVYVHHSPKLSVFTDDNGVGKDRRELVDCTNPAPWGGGNLNDHIPAQFHLAMDGYLYMAVGDKGIYGAKSNVDGRTAELRGGGLLRIRPDGRDMEVYCTGTRNHLDVSLNAEDEMFTYDNTDDGGGWWTRFTHMVDSGYYGYPYDYRPVDSDTLNMANYKLTKGAKPFRPWTLWRAEEYAGGSPCGAIGYNEDALPEEYRGNLIHCEWGKGQLERFVVQRDGATYKVVKREVLLKGGPGAFRPLGVCVTQDGMGFYIGDWNYGGWNNKKIVSGRLLKLSYTGGKSLAAPKPSWYIPAAQGQKFEATDAELIEGLKHPAQSVRLVAQRRLGGGKTERQAVDRLAALLKDKTAPAYARWHAIWALDSIDGGVDVSGTMASIVRDSTDDISARRQAARQLSRKGSAPAVAALIAALDDSDASLRFRAATSLGRIADPSATAPLIAKLDEKDFFTHFAVFTALHKIGMENTSAWKPLVAALSSDKKELREAAALAMRDAYDEPLITELCNLISPRGAGVAAAVGGEAAAPETRAAALKTLAPLVRKSKPWDGKWWGTRPQAGSPPAHDVNWPGTERASATIKSSLEDSNPIIRAAAVEALKLAPDLSAGPALAKLFESEKDELLLKNVLRALAASKSPAGIPVVLKLLSSPKENAELIPDAIAVARLLAPEPRPQGSNAAKLLSALLNLTTGPAASDLKVAALNALAMLPDPQAVPTLTMLLTDAELKVAIAAAAALGGNKGRDPLNALLATLLSPRRDVARAAAIALTKMKPSEAVVPLLAALNTDLRRDALLALAARPDLRAIDAYLDGMGGRDNQLRGASNDAIKNLKLKALPAIEARLEKNPPPMAVIAELKRIFEQEEGAKKSRIYSFDTKALAPEAFQAFALAHAGDKKKGEAVFKNKDLGCVKCHKIGNEGGDVGPALAGVGQKYPKLFLIETVLYPSKQILDGYHQWSVRLNSGEVLAGLIRAETPEEITLVTATAEVKKIKPSDIRKKAESKLSLMPEGLQLMMTQDDFADLIAYLESLKEKPPEAEKKETKQ